MGDTGEGAGSSGVQARERRWNVGRCVRVRTRTRVARQGKMGLRPRHGETRDESERLSETERDSESIRKTRRDSDGCEGLGETRRNSKSDSERLREARSDSERHCPES